MRSAAYRKPATRRLRVYAFDPQVSTRLDTAAFNCAVISLPWEEEWEDELRPGPINDYLEVIDVDPASGQFYDAVDLNHPLLLAQDGLAPSEGDPRFHQQMVFAIVMRTIRIVERALGRRVFWAPRWDDEHQTYVPVDRLRIHPHALREANAYYSRSKKALLFGYFQATARQAGANWVFTALSHDIIVHEATHAILDGLHHRYAEPTSVDSLAFHEAFADIVALLSHFMLEEPVRAHIEAQRGNIGERSLMSGLARQFGMATGRYAALREGIDDKGSDGMPDPDRLASLAEPHDRGAVLVAAVFDAFLTIHHQRTADLIRIGAPKADGDGRKDLHPDLVRRLTREATKSAEHVLRMCIRALDYMPPMDVRFGEFLRGIITADTDLVPDDRFNYRLAVIEAFRRRGIVPDGCLSLAPDSLLWEAPERTLDVRTLFKRRGLSVGVVGRRDESFRAAESNRKIVWAWLMEIMPEDLRHAWQTALGIEMPPAGSPKGQGVKVEIHSVRMTRRMGPDGQFIPQMVIEITQRRRYRPVADGPPERIAIPRRGDPDDGGFYFRGGATLVIDLREQVVRYVIRKRIDDDARLRVQADFIGRQRAGLAATYHAAEGGHDEEPFAMVHRGLQP